MGLRNQRGQVVIEYVLLLMVAVSMAYLLISRIASRDPGNAGFLVAKWQEVLKVVGEDLPDKKK